MGFFSAVKRIGRKSFRATKKLARLPGVRTVARGLPLVGTALAVAEGVDAAQDFFGGSPKSPSTLPSPLVKTSAGLPALPSTYRSSQSLVPRGPGGRLQVPFTGPSVPQNLSGFALDDQYLKTYYRAPKGYVVVKDANGKPYPLLKSIAKQMKLWKPNKKPPITVTDWESLKRSNRTVNKIKRINKMTQNIANFKTTTRKKCS